MSYGTQSTQGQGGPGEAPASSNLARVPLSRLTTFSAVAVLRRRRASGAARQQDARPVPPPGGGRGVPGFRRGVAIGGRYWLIQAGAAPGSQEHRRLSRQRGPWGPVRPRPAAVPQPGHRASTPRHDYRIMYEARAEPAPVYPRLAGDQLQTSTPRQ